VPGPKPDLTKPHSRHGGRGRGGRAVIVLPPECTLPAPKLPGGRQWSRQERALWKQLWSSPQASQWDDSHAASVAMYVCHVTQVLAGDGTAWVAQEARHLADELGLTPRGMLALGWVLPDPAPAPVVPLRGA
jgi:hypothetical protein